MSSTLDFNKLKFYLYFNSNRKNNTDLTSIKNLLEDCKNIEIDPKKKGVYYKKDFYEIVCKKLFNSLKHNDDFHKNINTKFILNMLRSVDALLLIENIHSIDDKFICGFAALNFFPDITLIHSQLIGFNCDVEGCRQVVFDFLHKFCNDVNMMHLQFGGLLLHIGN